MTPTPDEAVNLEAAVEKVGAFAAEALALVWKHGNPNGTPYEQGQNDMGHRMVTLASRADAALSASNARAVAAEEALREAQDTLIGAATRLRSFGRTTHEIDYEVERIETTLASMKENG